jgi:hypothetical protein
LPCASNTGARNISGLGKTLNTFFISLEIVAVYYGIFLHWFCDMISSA